MKKKFAAVFVLSAILAVFISACASTSSSGSTNDSTKDVDEIPKIDVSKIDDYKIEITGTEKTKYVYFYRYPSGMRFKGEAKRDSLIWETVENISFIIGEGRYFLKFSNYDAEKCLYEFVVLDGKGNKLEISENEKITLESDRAMTYFNPIADVKFKMGEKIIGRQKSPYNCVIVLNGLEFAKVSRDEQEKIDLGNQIICKKYKFKNYYDYIEWHKRCTFKNLYTSLNIGDYSNSIPFVVGDVVLMKENSLTIENMSTASGGYSYLVTAGKNQISKCCMIISRRQLNYTDFYGSMITEPMLLKFLGKGDYRQGYAVKFCDVFQVIDRDTKEYEDYVAMMNDIAEIEKNPYAHKSILDE